MGEIVHQVARPLHYVAGMNAASIFTPGEPITLIVPPRIQAMMSGVSRIECSHPRYNLVYEDGTQEGAVLSGAAPTEFFAIVSAVQSKRA